MPTSAQRPEDIHFISGVILVSRQPERMVSFYRDVCYPLTELGAQSQITAVRDPDGNLVELTQLGSDWLEHLKEHRAEGHDLISHWSAVRATPPLGGFTWPLRGGTGRRGARPGRCRPASRSPRVR
jgi:hypothetical protein